MFCNNLPAPVIGHWEPSLASMQCRSSQVKDPSPEDQRIDVPGNPTPRIYLQHRMLKADHTVPMGRPIYSRSKLLTIVLAQPQRLAFMIGRVIIQQLEVDTILSSAAWMAAAIFWQKSPVVNILLDAIVADRYICLSLAFRAAVLACKYWCR